MRQTEAPPLLRRYGIAVVSILIAVSLRVALQPVLGTRLPFVAFVVAAMFTAWYGGRGPGIFAVVLGAFMATAFVPLGGAGGAGWGIDRSLALSGYFTVGITGSLLCGSLRTALQRAEESEQQVLEKHGELEQALERQQLVEEALRQRNESLVEADRQKDAFLAMLGHELRTPLAAIRNSLLLIERRGAGTPEVEPLCGRVDRQVRRMGRIVDDLQDVSRIAQGRLSLQRERLDLVDLVRVTAEDHRGALAAAGEQLILELPEEPAVVEGDPNRLAQVLVNLLENASKFTDPDGQVTVDVVSGGPWATVTVRDSGIGIEAEMLPKVFDSFSQAEGSLDRSRGGLGMGLALVKGLVELHGGGVEATSQGPGQGAVFSFRLPVVAQAEERGTALPADGMEDREG
jgi:signal transduction histidine kinase